MQSEAEPVSLASTMQLPDVRAAPKCMPWPRLSPELYAGTVFAKSSCEGRECSLVTAFLDPCNHQLRIKPTSSSEQVVVIDVHRLQLILSGDKPKEINKLRKVLETCEEATTDVQCLSLYFGEWPWKELHLASSCAEKVQLWKASLQVLIKHLTARPLASRINYWLKCLYVELSRQNSGRVHAVIALGHFAGLRLWKAYKNLKQILQHDPVLKQAMDSDQELQNLSFPIFHALYFAYMATERPDIREIYRVHSSVCGESPAVVSVSSSAARPSLPGRRRSSLGLINFRSKAKPLAQTLPLQSTAGSSEGKCAAMSPEAFLAFLRSVQGLHHATLAEATALMQKYDFTPSGSYQPVNHMTLRGFTHFMMCQELCPETHQLGRVTQNMMRPLSDYFIASSHNTYLTGHQLHGESSVSMYTVVLHSSCRCVELDCWDGEEGEPVIYHGHTFTSKIKFKEVVQTIAEHAFATTPYPLILSIENHCSIQQQAKMVMYMKEAFGDMLLTNYIDGNPDRTKLPSPEELKHKILIKNRKSSSSSSSNTPEGTPLSAGDSPSPLLLPQHRRHSLMSFSSPVPSPLAGGSFFPRRSPLTQRSPTSSLAHHSPSPGSSPASSSTPSPTAFSPGTESRRLFRHSEMRQRKEGEVNPDARVRTLGWPWTQESPTCSSPHTDTSTLQVEMYTIFEEGASRSVSHTSSCHDLDEEGHSSHRDGVEGDREQGQLCITQTRKDGHVSGLGDSVSSEEDNKPQLRAVLPRNGKELHSSGSENCTSADVPRVAVTSDTYKECLTPALAGSESAEVVTVPTSHTLPPASEDEHAHQEQFTTDSTGSEEDSEPASISDDSDLARIGTRLKCRAVTKEDPQQDVPAIKQAETSELPLDLNVFDSGDSEGDEEQLTHSLPSSVLASKLHSQHLSENRVSVSLDACTRRGHQRKGSLPIHIQRVFPELAAHAVIRPQSPLVLHQLRSPLTTAKTLSREERRCSAPVLPGCSKSLLESDSEEEQPVLCGSLTALISPVALPKRARGAASSSPSSAASPKLGRRKKVDCEHSSSSESCVIEKQQSAVEQQSLFKRSVSLDETGTTDHSRSISTTAKEDEKQAGKAYPEEAIRNREGLELKGIAVKTSKSATRGSTLYCRRRRGSLGILQGLSSLSSPTHSELTLMDTAEDSFSHKDISQELSDLVIYTEPVKFSSFKAAAQRPCSKMFSMSEPATRKAAKKCPQEYLGFNRGHLSRVYPSARRINSSNFSPGEFWMYGCQMVALNYQTNDVPMEHNMSVFRQNGGCGYVLKPEHLVSACEQHLLGTELESSELTITVISGQHLQSSQAHLPSVEIEVLGAPYDSGTFRSQASHFSGCCTLWNRTSSTCTVKIVTKELAALRFSVHTSRSQDCSHSHTIPVGLLGTGYKHVYFSDGSGGLCPPPSLLLHTVIKDSTSVVAPPPAVCVKVGVGEVEPHSLDLTDCQGLSVGEVIGRLIETVGLGGGPEDYHLLQTVNGNDYTLGSNAIPTPGSVLCLEDAPPPAAPRQLAVVPVQFDLEGVEHEPITLFAGVSTTAGDLLAGAVARLSGDVLRLCPGIRDREDEEEIQRHFCFVLRGVGLERRRVLECSELVAPCFPPESSSCLLLHTTGQPHDLQEDKSSLHSRRPHLPEQQSPDPVSRTGSGSQSPEPLLRTGTVVATDSVDLAEVEGQPGVDSSAQRSVLESPISPKTSTKVRPVCPEKAKRYLEDYYHQLELRSEQRIRQRKKKRAVSFSQADLQWRKKLQLPGVQSEDSATQGRHSRRMSVDVGLMLGQAMIQAPHNHSLQHNQLQGGGTAESTSTGNVGEVHTCSDNSYSPLRLPHADDTTGPLSANYTARSSVEHTPRPYMTDHTHKTTSILLQETVEAVEGAVATPKHKKNKKWRMSLMKRFGNHVESQGDTGTAALRKQLSSPSLACQQLPDKPSKCTTTWRQLSSPALQLIDTTHQKQALVSLRKRPQMLLAMGRLPAGTVVAESLHSKINGNKLEPNEKERNPFTELGTQPLSKELSWREREWPHPLQRSASFQHRTPRHYRPRFPSQPGPSGSDYYRDSKVEDSATIQSKCGSAWSPGTATICEQLKELGTIHTHQNTNEV